MNPPLHRGLAASACYLDSLMLGGRWLALGDMNLVRLADTTREESPTIPFFNDTLRNYHAGAAADSWRRVLAFFAEHVKSRHPTSS
jgi:hypothetical protein